jgi:hypothetical protein
MYALSACMHLCYPCMHMCHPCMCICYERVGLCYERVCMLSACLYVISVFVCYQRVCMLSACVYAIRVFLRVCMASATHVSVRVRVDGAVTEEKVSPSPLLPSRSTCSCRYISRNIELEHRIYVIAHLHQPRSIFLASPSTHCKQQSICKKATIFQISAI